MRARVFPGPVHGQVTVPASKSQTLRALLFAAMADTPSTITNQLESLDTDAMRGALQNLGGTIDVGRSGIVLRFVGALAALSSATFTGDLNRPLEPLLSGLRQWGAHVDFPHISGPLGTGIAHIDGSDSQPVSGLLIAASYAPGERELIVDPIGERPWLDLTLQWLRRLGAQITENRGHFHIVGGLRHPGFTYRVPADFSSAAFPFAAGLIAGDVELLGLDYSDSQGDRHLLDVLKNMPSEIDVNPFVDGLPILAVMGCYSDHETRLYNGAIARTKESDRIHAICTELQKMGADIEERPDGLIVRPSKLAGAEVSSWTDQRIAMSLAVAALGADGPTTIEGADSIAKTYQTFWRDLCNLGVKCDFDWPSGVREDDVCPSLFQLH